MPTEGDSMSDSSVADPEIMKTHADEPILERRSDIHGWIKVYPPACDADEWGEHGWLLTTEYLKNKTNEGPGLHILVKPSEVMKCYEKPHFVTESDYFTT